MMIAREFSIAYWKLVREKKSAELTRLATIRAHKREHNTSKFYQRTEIAQFFFLFFSKLYTVTVRKDRFRNVSAAVAYAF